MQGLLKFAGPTRYALENLRKSVLYCQHFEGFNDPFEFWTRFKDGIPDLEAERARFIAAINAWGFGEEQLSDALEHAGDYFDSVEGLQPAFQIMADTVRIACFGSQRDNLLMWSHYADGLRGFCIVFQEELIVKAEPVGYITDVAYLKEPPVVDAFVYAIFQDQQDYNLMAMHETKARVRFLKKENEEKLVSGYREYADDALNELRKLWQHAFAAKPFEWLYEKERRLLVRTSEQNRNPILRPYPKEAVKEIIVGERMPAAYLAQLKTIVEERFGDIPIHTARRPADRYALVIE